MDQQKIGEFITLLRKSKNMTQVELAEKLGITDKAVSKWEKGKSMPDISLLKPLSDIFAITVHELLLGEFVQEENFREKADENIVQIMQLIENVKRKKYILYGIVIFAIGMALFGVAHYFDDTASPFGEFINGLSLGLSVGTMVVGIVSAIYGAVKLEGVK
ncbi:helix-turn-helix transcriptional regulator [Bacillaceae bacterium Marseille-Q3522]|nr:helix-turn-helix transcriptional regulator [Bacillaceae bacterium Marseille-Q3522]